MRPREDESNRDRNFENPKIILRSPAKFWRRGTRSRLNPALDARRAHCSTLHTRMITHWWWDPVHFPFISFEVEHRISLATFCIKPAQFNFTTLVAPLAVSGFFLFTYRRSVWRLLRSTSSWFNEKVDCVTRRWTKN